MRSARARWLGKGLICWLTCGEPASSWAQQQPVTEAQADNVPADGATSYERVTVHAPDEPSPEIQEQYRNVVTSAISEFDGGRFAEARALFLRAHELWPSARTLRTLGMTAFELRMYPRALSELQSALDDPRRPLPTSQREQVETLVERTRSFVGRYRVSVSPHEAELIVDGVPFALAEGSLLLLPLGNHELVARAPGHRELHRQLEVESREDDALALQLEPISAPPLHVPAPLSSAAAAPTPTLAIRATVRSLRARGDRPDRRAGRKVAIAAFGFGAGVAVLAAVMSGLVLKRKNSMEEHCPEKACPPRYWNDLDEMKRFANAATATALVSGLSIAAGMYLWFSSGSSNAKTIRVTLLESRSASVGLGIATRY